MKNLKINQQIKAKEVRLVGENNEQLGILPFQKALELAVKSGLDLVEVAPTSKPCVCKIMDYGKFKYEQEKKNSGVVRKIDVKEIRLRPSMDEHDLKTKLKQVQKIISENDKVRVVILFKGRELSHVSLGWKLLEKIVENCKGLIKIEQQPKLEGNRMFMLISPLKKNDEPKDNASVGVYSMRIINSVSHFEHLASITCPGAMCVNSPILIP